MPGRLEVTDMVFAAFLIRNKCELCDIIVEREFGKPPKRYIFSEEVKYTSLEAQFLGLGCVAARDQWVTFIDFMNRLTQIEDVRLRQSHSRHEENGIKLINKEKRWITTSQSTAAFLLNPTLEEKNIILVDVVHLGPNKGYRFIFNEADTCQQEWTLMTAGFAAASWWIMKACHKRVTGLRLAKEHQARAV